MLCSELFLNNVYVIRNDKNRYYPKYDGFRRRYIMFILILRGYDIDKTFTYFNGKNNIKCGQIL